MSAAQQLCELLTFPTENKRYVSLDEKISIVADDLRSGNTSSYAILVDDYLSGNVSSNAGSRLIILADSYAKGSLGKQNGRTYSPQTQVNLLTVNSLYCELKKLVLHRKTTLTPSETRGVAFYAARVLATNGAFKSKLEEERIKVPELLKSYELMHPRKYLPMHPVNIPR